MEDRTNTEEEIVKAFEGLLELEPVMVYDPLTGVAEDLSSVLDDLAGEAYPTLQAFSTGDDRDDIARYGLCLVLEAAELVNSLPWKRWARHPADLEKSKEEFADMLCFLGSIVELFHHLGVSNDDLAGAYVAKVVENRKRFAEYWAKTEGT